MNDIKFINLNNNVDLNDITNRGIYEIKGYANQNTSLPIGHLTEEYVNGLLIVLDNSNTSKNVSITQFLILSSTLKNIYIRKGVGDINNIIWDSWIKELNNGTIDDLTNISDRINNNVKNIDELFKRLQGISEYTNPLTDPFEFLGEFADISELINFLDNFKQNKGEFRALVNNNLIIINSNHFGGITSQIIKGCVVLNEDNTIKFSGFYNEYCRFYFAKWTNWDIINKQDITKLINSEIGKLLEGTDPEKIDSIKDLINWVDEHGKDAAEMASAIQANTDAIDDETNRATAAEKDLSDRIDNIPTGDIADGAVTERKLSIDVKNKLNTAYDKANLADSLFINDGITFIQGGYNNEGNDFYPGTNAVATSLAFQPNGERITVNDGYVITRYFFMYNEEVVDMDKINSNYYDTGEFAGTEELGLRIEIRKSDNTAINANEYPNIVKSFIRKPIAWYASCSMNNFVCAGRYVISGSREANAQDNMPILNGGKIEARLEVLENENTLVQILTLLNVGGGDGNIYTRTRQDNTWGQWGKLQTNVEVGVINQQQMDALVDNGIYSGILSTTGETFVIICINNYAIAQQVGVHHISQLKYSLVVGTAEVKIEKRTRDAYGFWTEWQGIGGGSTLSEATKVTWDANSNMNDFKTAGLYDIYGERTRQDDNLPILNASSGHSIAARLTVVASTLQPANNEICVTQFLQLSNRIGGEGATYVRTYNENNNGMNGWSAWQKQMGMVETLINSNDATVGQEIFTDGSADKIGNGINGMTDNGMYSGIYIDNLKYTGTQQIYYLSAQPTFVETFVLVVINDYAASGKLNLPRHITQLKYAVDAITGQSTVKKRVGTGNDDISWGDWQDIGGGGSNEIELDINTIIAANSQGYKINTLISQGLIKENVTYVLNFQNGYWYSLKTFFSSKPINTYFEKGKSATTESELKIIYRNHNDDPVLWIEGYNAVGDYYIMSIKNPHEDTEVIKVSSPMTVLE